MLLVPLAAAANDAGDLDASFGNGGTVTTEVGVASSGQNDLALQADGKIVSFGQADPRPDGPDSRSRATTWTGRSTQTSAPAAVCSPP